jgi:hypothetical protein
VQLGDVLSVDWNGSENGLMFLKEAEGALVPMDSPVPGAMTEAAAASSDGRHVIAPAATTAIADVAIPKMMPVLGHRSLPAEKAKNEKK